MNDVISNAFERHAQTVLALLLTALLVWVGKTTQDTSITIARMEVELRYLREENAKPHNHGDIGKEIAAIRAEITAHIAECNKRNAN